MKKVLLVLVLVLPSCSVYKEVPTAPEREKKATWLDIIWPPSTVLITGGALFELGANQ